MRKQRAKDLYESTVTTARQPVFYEDLGVPDTVDGRFEMICLHNYVVTHRLNQVGDKKMGQALFDAFFVNMDRSLRERGIGDLAVPKHMKRMMQGFNGRCQSYEACLGDKDALEQALLRNVYATVDTPDKGGAATLANYVLASLEIKEAEQGFAPIDLNSNLEREGKSYA